MNDKPKCPVFGCTIPRGIPHEHPAGVSAVMRDPAGPLDADERAELERYRAEDVQDRRTVFVRSNLNNKPHISLEDMLARYAEPGSLGDEPIPRSNVYIVPYDAPMVPGRKLRDALVLAGHKPRDHEEWCRLRHIDPVTGDTFEAIKARELLADQPAPRRLFVSTTARVAFWIVLAVTVAIWIFAGVKS